MAARKTVWTPDIVRSRIQVGVLVNRLEKQAAGQLEMTPNQLRATEILLRKTLPDLSQVDHSGSIETSRPEELSDARLADIASGRRSRTAETQTSEEVPSELH